MTSSLIPIRHTLIFSHVLDELKNKSNHKEISMHKNVTKKLFTQKVIKELEQHPFYLENKTRFDIAINKFQQMEKDLAIKDIMTLLEQNFKYKIGHKKKFHNVMKELHLHFHKQKYSKVMKELHLHFHKQKYSKVMKELLDRDFMEKTNVFEHNPHQIEHMLVLFFVGVLFIRTLGLWFKDV
jgi:hypothetical protein